MVRCHFDKVCNDELVKEEKMSEEVIAFKMITWKTKGQPSRFNHQTDHYSAYYWAFLLSYSTFLDGRLVHEAESEIIDVEDRQPTKKTCKSSTIPRISFVDAQRLYADHSTDVVTRIVRRAFVDELHYQAPETATGSMSTKLELLVIFKSSVDLDVNCAGLHC
jgi:hypothetical protein